MGWLLSCFYAGGFLFWGGIWGEGCGGGLALDGFSIELWKSYCVGMGRWEAERGEGESVTDCGLVFSWGICYFGDAYWEGEGWLRYWFLEGVVLFGEGGGVHYCLVFVGRLGGGVTDCGAVLFMGSVLFRGCV